jgi:hypothetical protein
MAAFTLPSKLSNLPMASFNIPSKLSNLPSIPSRTSKNPLKTLLAKMSEMRNRMREKWSE